MKNEDGYDIEYTYIKSVQTEDDWYYITKDDGWTFGVSKEECGTLVPEPGDDLEIYTTGFSNIHGITIAGNVVRYKTPAQVEQERQEWLADYEQKKIDRFHEMKDEWQIQVSFLHPTLQRRIRRFEKKQGFYEFWKEDGGYELCILTGATALYNWAVGPDRPQDMTPDEAVVWWWSLNSKEHGYDYKRQMEIIPEFGDGHSGNTAGAAYSLARGLITGSYTES